MRFLADENLNKDLVRAVRRERPDIDLVTVQEAGMSAARDPDVLAAAAAQGRVVITHDARTLVGLAYERVIAGLPMPGVIVIPSVSHVGRMAEDLLIVMECLSEAELDGQVQYLPL